MTTSSFYSQNPTPQQAESLLEETLEAAEAAEAAAAAATATVANALIKTNNLSDVSSPATSLLNLGGQPLDSDLTAIAALSTTAYGRSFLALADAAAARTLISAQPLDADLTSIAALTTTAFGRGLLTETNAASILTTLGTAALYQPLDSDLTAIAALTTTSFGRALLALANQNALRDYTQQDQYRAVSTQNSNFSFTTADRGTLFRCNTSTTQTITMPLGSSVAVGELFHFRGTGTGSATLTCSGSDAFLGGFLTVGIGQNGFVSIYWDGFGWQVASTGRVTTAGGMRISGAGLLSLYRPSFKASKSADQTGIATGVATKVLFQTEQHDTESNFASSTWTCPVTGVYRFSVSLQSSAIGTTFISGGGISALLYVNGVDASLSGFQGPVGGNAACCQTTATISLAAGATVEVYYTAQLTGAGSITILNSGFTHFSGEMI